MIGHPSQPPGNRLLAYLRKHDAAALLDHIEPIDLPLKMVLIEPDEVIPFVYFLDEGIASVVARSPEGFNIEVGFIGREGFVLPGVALGATTVPNLCEVQIAGHGHRIAVSEFREAMEGDRVLRDLCLRFAQTVIVGHALHRADREDPDRPEVVDDALRLSDPLQLGDSSSSTTPSSSSTSSSSAPANDVLPQAFRAATSTPSPTPSSTASTKISSTKTATPGASPSTTPKATASSATAPTRTLPTPYDPDGTATTSGLDASSTGWGSRTVSKTWVDNKLATTGETYNQLLSSYSCSNNDSRLGPLASTWQEVSSQIPASQPTVGCDTSQPGVAATKYLLGPSEVTGSEISDASFGQQTTSQGVTTGGYQGQPHVQRQGVECVLQRDQAPLDTC